jgi:molybdopterin-guanine dinucleotide biosynthesis protein A
MSVPQLYGIVAAGGMSSRMGMDKGLLQYYSTQQRYHIYKMLENYCDKVFISCSISQADDIENKYNYVTDASEFINHGPLTVLLTAFKMYPKKNFIMIGCDYPFFSSQDMATLARQHRTGRAGAYYNAGTDLYEPLLGYYPASISSELLLHKSLQGLLKSIDAAKILPVVPASLKSIDTKEEYEKALATLTMQSINNE